MFNSSVNLKSTDQQKFIIITIVWLIIQCILFLQNGIEPILESLKYIGAAQNLLTTGKLPEIRYYFYFSTTILIAFCLKTGLGYVGVVCFQLVLNFLATIAFYKALVKVDEDGLSAFISTLFLIICIPYQIWNFYLYTESLFFSFTLLFFAFCIKYGELNGKRIVVQFLFLLLALISRPLGILLLPWWILLLIFGSNKFNRPFILTCFLLSSIFLVTISNSILGTIGDWQVLMPAEKNYIICETPIGIVNDLSHLKNGSPLNQLAHYVINYPTQFFDLALRRLYAFFILTRDYYSNKHNYFLLILDLILYLPILANLIFFTKITLNKISIFSILIILSFAIVVGLQCDDYHNRFHHALIPLFIYLGTFLFIKNMSINIEKHNRR